MIEQRLDFEKREDYFQAIAAAEILGLAWRSNNEVLTEGMGTGNTVYVLFFRPREETA